MCLRVSDLASEVYTPRERVALRFAELLALDHHQIDDALFDELRRYFTGAEVIELGVSVARNLGLGRLNAVLGLEPV